MIRKSYRQASVHEYINITKQLPSTNPIRSPTPDIHSRKERIEKTMSPNIAPNRTHLKNITNSNSKYQNLNQNKDFERILEAKDEKILSLQKELEILQRNPNSFSMKNSDFHNKAPKEQEEMVEKLRILIKAKEDENQDLRKKMEMSLQESNAKTDNKIREILLKFYQEINVLKAENKQLTDLMEHKNPQQQHIHVEGKYMDPYNNNVNDHSISEKSSKNSRIIDNNPRLNESNHKPYIPEQQHGYTPDHNHQLDKSQTTPFNNNPEKSKKANQHIQGGTISPYHEPQPLSATFNVIVDESVPKLKSHIAERDVKIRVLAEELEKINDVLKMKNQENIELLERIKRNNHGDYDESIKLKQLLQSKLQELEDLKTKLPKEDNEKLKALALRTPALLDEIKELNEVITKLRKEHHENEEKMVALAHEVERLADLLKHQANNHSNTQYYDEKIALLAQEIERLNEMVKNQNNELQRLRPLEPQMEALKREHEILADKHINKNKALEAKLKELELLKEKCLLIDKAFSAEKEGLHEKAEMLEKKAHSLITENQDLSRLHRKSIEEKNAHENEALKLIGLNQELVQEIKSLTDALKNKHQENEFKTQEIESLKSRLNEVEMHKANVLSSHEFEKKKSITVIQENDRKNLLIDNLTQEINSLRNRLLEQESKGFTQEKEHEKLKKSHQEAVQNMGSLQNQIEFIQGRHQEKVQNSEVELKQKEADLREVKQKLMNLEQEKTNEISKVRDSISESYMKQEHEKRKTLGVMAEKEGLQMECEVLRKERKDFQHKCQELKKSLFQSESETNKLKAQNEEFLLRIVLLSALNETLSNDMNEIRENHSDLNNKFMKLNNEKSIEELKLKESLNETQKHHEREKRKSIQILQEKESINKTLDMVARDKEDLHKRLYDNEVKQIELQSQLKQISSKYEEALIRVAVMSCELQRLLENIDNDSNMKRIHIEEVRKDCEEKLKAANDRKRKEFDDLKQENEHESKRLLTMIHGLEEQNEALIRKHASDRSDFIAKYEKAMKETIAKNINDMNTSHQQELEQVQLRISEHQKLADKYKQELEKMASMMSEKHEEVSNWREKVQKLEQQRLLELEELKKHLDLLKNSYVNNPNGLEFQAERLAYETNISQLKSRISALEASIREKHMKQDVQIREYETKNQELRAKIRSYENSKENEIIGFKEMNERLKGQFDETKEKLLRSENDAGRMELEVKQLQIALGALRSELDQMQKSLELEKLENSRLHIRVKEAESVYRREIEEGVRIEKNEKTKELEMEIMELTRTRDEYREKADKNERALTEMNGVLVSKIQELERMKNQYQESINNVHMLEGKLLEKLQEDEVFIS